MHQDTTRALPLFGALLDSVMKALPKGIKATRQDGALIVLGPDFTTTVDIVAPPSGYTSDFTPQTGRIKAVVQIRSELPPVFNSPESRLVNDFATVGALTVEADKVFVGSRITLFENDDDAWNVWFPVVVYAVAFGMPSMIGGLNPELSEHEGKHPKSSWTASDFKRTENALSNSSVCTTSGTGLTVEFGLHRGAATAIAGDATALVQLRTDQSHPLLGRGLFCLLQMPHIINQEEHLREVLDALNRQEMTPDNPAPHFGAWCRGQLEQRSNPAYLTVLPNKLHSDWITATFATATRVRAMWANTVLASLGVPDPRE